MAGLVTLKPCSAQPWQALALLATGLKRGAGREEQTVGASLLPGVERKARTVKKRRHLRSRHDA